jgi:hypothetical protein
MRGRGNGGGRHSGGGHNSGGGSHHRSSGTQDSRRVNPRVQSFDSNGPEVRIRGTAYQINEKYVTLARDANASGDRVLAESYLQHAEHYQRFINEMTEEYNLHNPPQQQQPVAQQPMADGNAAVVVSPDTLNDLDQGFLVGTQRGQDPTQQEQPRDNNRGNRNFTPRRNNETEPI